MINKSKDLYYQLIESLFCTLGLVIFALFIHKSFPLLIVAFLGLFMAAFIINRNIKVLSDIPFIFGMKPLSRSLLLYLIIGLLIGILLGFVFRGRKGYSFLPEKLTYFVFIAAIIGSAEEVVFRGFIQGHLRPLGLTFSILFATLSHTLYKTGLFFSPSSTVEINLIFLAQWTFIVGILLGILKEFSQNVFPALIAHACFDVLVYGDYPEAPWWVW